MNMKKVIGLVVSGLLVLNLMGAKSIKDYQADKNKINKQINKIDQQKGQLKNKLTANKSEVKHLSALKNTQSKEYKRLLAEERQIAAENKLVEADLKLAREEYNGKLDLLKERIKVSYENTTMSYVYILLDSTSIVDFTYRLGMISKIIENDEKIVNEAEAAKKNMEDKLRIREEMRARKEQAANEAKEKFKHYNESIRKLAIKMAQAKQGIRDLEIREDEMAAQQSKIANLIRSLQPKASAPSSNASHGSLLYPVPGSRNITSPFGWRIHPIYKTKKFHSGVDLAASYGASIFAAESGTVIYAGWQSGYGNTVIVDHGGGLSTLYAHCSSIKVSNGQKVSRGQTIALVGSTGASTGPHLHFEVHVNGSAVNPENYI